MHLGGAEDLQALTLNLPQLPLRCKPSSHSTQRHADSHSHALSLMPSASESVSNGAPCTYVVPHKSSVVMIADLTQMLERLVRKKLIKRKHLHRILDAVKRA